MAQGFADLHIHTNYSDGFWSPAEVVERVAAEGDLAVIAIKALPAHGQGQALSLQKTWHVVSGCCPPEAELPGISG